MTFEVMARHNPRMQIIERPIARTEIIFKTRIVKSKYKDFTKIILVDKNDAIRATISHSL